LRAQSGDADAMATFFDQFAMPILLAVRARMNPELRSAWDSADFVQRARIKLDRCDLASKHFETPRAFLAYVVRVAEREVQQAKRKRQHRQKPLDGLTPAEAEQMVDRSPGPLSADVQKEFLQNALAALKPQEREIIVLLGQHYKHEEVAEKLQISERTVGRAVMAFGDVLKKMREADE
jgi:RNA polymerase sigma factor (sigma-70 family)